MNYCHNTSLHFDIYSFLFRILQIVGCLLVLVSRIVSTHIPFQLHIGGIQKSIWQLGLSVWLCHQKKDSLEFHMQIFSYFNSQALCHCDTFRNVTEIYFGIWNEFLSS